MVTACQTYINFCYIFITKCVFFSVSITKCYEYQCVVWASNRLTWDLKKKVTQLFVAPWQISSRRSAHSVGPLKSEGLYLKSYVSWVIYAKQILPKATNNRRGPLLWPFLLCLCTLIGFARFSRVNSLHTKDLPGTFRETSNCLHIH